MKEMSERRAHLLMQRGSETLRRSTGSLFACIVTHPMRSARSCAAVMAMGSWKQPDERCYIEQPWAPSLGTKMTPGERTDRKSCLSFRANFPNLESVGKCRSNWTRQELWKAFEHAQRRTVSPTAPGFSETRHIVPGNTSHDHLSASVGPEVAQRASPSATCDMVWCAEREQEAAGRFWSKNGGACGTSS